MSKYWKNIDPKFIHPKKFDDSFKEICRMNKPKSPNMIVFQVDPMDDGDEWFIMCSYVKKKTGVISNSSTLIRKDLGGWIKGIMSMEKYGDPEWNDIYTTEQIKELFNYG